MVQLCRRIAEDPTFQSFILFLILLNAAAMGLETAPELLEAYWEEFFYFALVSQFVFVAEIAVRLVAYFPKPRQFFDDFWNVFDFTIVVLSLVPGIGSFALIARLFRVLRILRVVSVSDRMRAFMDRLHESLDEAIYCTMILAVLGYVFSISGFYLFAEIDPERWGSLGRAGLSIFYLMLLQNVPAYIEPLVGYSKLSLIYFMMFYLLCFSLLLGVLNATIMQSGEEEER